MNIVPMFLIGEFIVIIIVYLVGAFYYSKLIDLTSDKMVDLKDENTKMYAQKVATLLQTHY
jgi:hypothetical protein